MRIFITLATFAILSASCGRNDFTPLIETLAAPVIGTASGTYETDISVSLASESGTSIRYSTDADAVLSDASAWMPYESPVSVDRTMKLRAYAYRDEANISPVSAADFRVVTSDPSFSQAPGSYSAPVSVAISSPASGAVIRYTLDGTDPTDANGTAISNGSAVVISTDSVLKARAFLSPRDPSAVIQGSYFFIGAFEIGITLSLPGNVSYVFSGAAASLVHGTDMTVTATHSLPAPSYQWYLNGVSVPGATSVSLTLGNSGVLGTLDYGAYTLTLEILSGGYSYTEDVEFDVVP